MRSDEKFMIGAGGFLLEANDSVAQLKHFQYSFLSLSLSLFLAALPPLSGENNDASAGNEAALCGFSAHVQ